MSEKRHYIVYKTTCLKNGKYYIGCHSTDDLNDGYLGSGVELKKDIARFGCSAFRRETLYECASREEAATKEREFANRDVANDPNSYNKVIGGALCGVKTGRSEEARKRYQKDPIYRARENKRSAERKHKNYQKNEVYRECQKERYRKRYHEDHLYRQRQFKGVRKCRYKKRFKQKLTTSTEFRDSFVLRCKANATLLEKTLELFRRDLDFCELLKNLVEK